MIGEPSATPYDVQFQIRGIPVRIHPLFWGAMALLGVAGAARSAVVLAIWLLVVTFSILVHELGHAVFARRYGWPPRIFLYGMGGAAVFEPRRPTTASRVLIALAGPFAGFAVGGLVAAAVLISGHAFALPPGIVVGGGPALGGRLGIFVDFMLFVNIFWGLVNLAPIQPLDGGHVVAAVLTRMSPRYGLERSFLISAITAATFSVLGAVLLGSAFIAVLFGILAYQSYATWDSLREPSKPQYN